MNEQLNMLEALRPLARMVAEELHALMAQDGKPEAPAASPGRELLRGLKGLQEALHCGKNKAAMLRRSGVLGDAILELPGSNTFLVDRDKALKALENWQLCKRKGRIMR